MKLMVTVGRSLALWVPSFPSQSLCLQRWIEYHQQQPQSMITAQTFQILSLPAPALIHQTKAIFSLVLLLPQTLQACLLLTYFFMGLRQRSNGMATTGLTS